MRNTIAVLTVMFLSVCYAEPARDAYDYIVIRTAFGKTCGEGVMKAARDVMCKVVDVVQIRCEPSTLGYDVAVKVYCR